MSKSKHLSVRVFKTAWFAKAARKARIDDVELLAFRTLAKAYAGLTDKQVEQLLQDKDLTELCHDDQAKIQE